MLVHVTLRGRSPSATAVPAVLLEKLADRCTGSSLEQRGQRTGFGIERRTSLGRWLSVGCPVWRQRAPARCFAGGSCRERERETEREKIMTNMSNEICSHFTSALRFFCCFEHHLCDMLAKLLRLPLS